MAERMKKDVRVVFYRRNFLRDDWRIDFDEELLLASLREWAGELEPLGIRLSWEQEEHSVEVRGYHDLLNAVRIRSSRDGLGNPCLGHVIGQSQNRDPVEDLRRGINRVAFAPETIEPDGNNKVVCHNCGCGC